MRVPSTLFSTASESLGKTKCEIQNVPPEWNSDDEWSSQECESDEVLEARMVRLLSEQPAGLFAQHTERFVVDDDDVDSYAVKATIFGWKGWDRIKTVSGIQIVHKRVNHHRRKTVFDLENVCVLIIGISSIHEEESYGQLTFHYKYKRHHNGKNIWHIFQIRVWTRWDLEWRQLVGKVMHGNVFYRWCKSHQSSTHKDLGLCRFLIFLDKSSRIHPSIERCMGTKIGMVQIIFGSHKLWQNRHWAIGNVAAQWQSQWSTEQLGRSTRNFHKKTSIYVNVQWHFLRQKIHMKNFSCRCSTTFFLWINKQWKRIHAKCQSRFSICKKIRSSTLVIPRTCIRESRLVSMKTVPQGEWDKMAEKMMGTLLKSGHQFSESRVHPVVDSEACRFGNCWDYFSHNCLCKRAQS